MEPKSSLLRTLDPFRSHLNPVHTPTLYKIHFNIILSIFLCLPSGLLLSDLPITIMYSFLISPMHTTCLVHLILLNNVNL
jgi:hypothetical protein